MNMKFKLDGKSILIILLLAILIGSWIFKNDIARLLGEKKQVIKELVEVEKELSQGILDSLALIPVYEAEIASLKERLDSTGQQIIIIEQVYDSLQMVIDNQTVTEDMIFFAEYIDADIFPRLLHTECNTRVIITPLQLKRTNHIFLSHDTYVQKYPLLISQVTTLEDLNDVQGREISTLKNTIMEYDKRYLVNQDIILQKNEMIKLQKKQKRRRTFGIIAGGLIGFGVGAVIFK